MQIAIQSPRFLLLSFKKIEISEKNQNIVPSCPPCTFVICVVAQLSFKWHKMWTSVRKLLEISVLYCWWCWLGEEGGGYKDFWAKKTLKCLFKSCTGLYIYHKDNRQYTSGQFQNFLKCDAPLNKFLASVFLNWGSSLLLSR